MNVDIFAMQLFGGLSFATILLLMALGLAIVFGLMGVINMAHGEIMALGAYATFLVAHFFEVYLPGAMHFYLLCAIPLAFLAAFVFGLVLEWGRHPLVLQPAARHAACHLGISLIMQQAFRTIFGAQEVTVPLTSWLDGAWEPVPGIQLPLNRIFIIVLTIVVSFAIYLLFFKTRMGLRARAVTQNRAIAEVMGINTRRVDMFTFALGSGLAGIAGAVFTMIGSTNPSTGQLYIVDSFIVVVFGGVASILGTVASSFLIAQIQTTFEYLTTGSYAKVILMLIVVTILYFRPTGLFSPEVRT
ncbi:MAG: urea ABC transporter permease subunit UrtB [Burkholderiaceae bacterium]|nr:urea ABC transporter permease subunit UrtB [Burkholderiaceae bacterium]